MEDLFLEDIPKIIKEEYKDSGHYFLSTVFLVALSEPILIFSAWGFFVAQTEDSSLSMKMISLWIFSVALLLIFGCYVFFYRFKLIKKIHHLFEISNTETDIQEILTQIEDIYQFFTHKKIFFSYMTSQMGKNGTIALQRIQEQKKKSWWAIIEFLVIFLRKLSIDLQDQVTKQKQTLEQAKSEVEKNIQWTGELAQVSDLQKARLDRQIEQFEELQRILVKV